MADLDNEIKRRVQAATQFMDTILPVRAVYLFGSHVEGTADRYSDIDIAFFLEGVENWDISRRAQVMFKIQEKVGLDLEPHFFPAQVHEHPEKGSFAEYIINHGLRVDLEKSRSSSAYH